MVKHSVGQNYKFQFVKKQYWKNLISFLMKLPLTMPQVFSLSPLLWKHFWCKKYLNNLTLSLFLHLSNISEFRLSPLFHHFQSFLFSSVLSSPSIKLLAKWFYVWQSERSQITLTGYQIMLMKWSKYFWCCFLAKFFLSKKSFFPKITIFFLNTRFLACQTHSKPIFEIIQFEPFNPIVGLFVLLKNLPTKNHHGSPPRTC